MKKHILLLLLIGSKAIAQVGINTITPEASSLLEVFSTNKGFLLPRFNIIERNAITNPAEGLLLFNTTTKKIEWHANSIWYELPTSINPINALSKPIITSVDVTEPGSVKIYYTPAVSASNQSITYQAFTIPGNASSTVTANPLIITNVPFGQTVSVGVKAITSTNNILSDLSSVTIPYFYSTPSINTVTSTDSGFTVNFTASTAYDGSTPTYEFLIEPGNIVVPATTSPATITNLSQASIYTLKLRAVGTVLTGNSLYSTAVNATTLAKTPLAPSNVVATSGNGSATISFVPAAFNFANSNLSYELVANPGNFSVTGTSSPLTIFGLNNGTSYTFSVKAKNYSLQSSAVNASSASTPTATAIAIQPNVTAGNKELLVQWNNAAAGATSYEVAYKLTNSTFWKTKSTQNAELGLTLNNLMNGQAYDVKVRPVTSGSQFPFSPIVSATPQATSAGVPEFLSHIIITGQSLAGGAGPGINSNIQPFENLMLSGSNLVPLTIPYENVGVPLSNQLSFLTPPANRFRSISSTFSTGNTPYSGIKKGTPHYTASLNAIIDSRTAVTQTLNKSYKVAAVIEVHGENDHFANGPNPMLIYQGHLEEWQRDYEIDAALITGQKGTLPFFSSQNANWQSYATARPSISLAQLNTALDNPDKIYMVGPRYIYDYTDIFHMTNYSYRRLGEYYGKAVKKVLVDKEPFLPLYPINALLSGNTITVNFHVPVPPLQWDIVGVLARENFGFEFLESTPTATITNMALGANGTSVVITLSNTPTGSNMQIAYAAKAVPNSGAIGRMDANAPGGNLTDSDTTPALNQDSSVPANMGTTLKNWCVTFMIPVYNSSNYDAIAPVINLSGNTNMTITQGTNYTEPGYTAIDAVNGIVTNRVKVSTTLNTAEVGTYTVNYKVSDFNRNWSSATRTVQVVAATDTVAPVLQLVGTSTLSIPLNTNFVDPGCTANDAISGNVSANILVTGTVNTSVPGTYTLTYNVSDEAGNAASSITRTVIVTN